jgi:hypothetical protein
MNLRVVFQSSLYLLFVGFPPMLHAVRRVRPLVVEYPGPAVRVS